MDAQMPRGRMINRRMLVIALGAAVLIAPFGSLAQQSRVWRVGYLAQISTPSISSGGYAEFLRGMRELGYIEGKNLVVEARFADNKLERLPSLAAELVQLKLDAIVSGNTSPTRALQKATTNIPIIMTNDPDPVGAGFVKSLARPGGNITGLSIAALDISPKLLEMLRSMMPELSRVAVLVNPANASHSPIVKSIEAAAHKIGVTIVVLEARNSKEIEDGIVNMARQRIGALVIPGDGFFNSQARELADLATRNRLASIGRFLPYASVGGLMSYGPRIDEMHRRAATYVDKILKGAKPGDIPVEQPTKFELIINGTTAKALGLTIPQSLLISADKVIE